MTEVGTITARIVAIADDITGVTADDEFPNDLTTALPVPFLYVEEGAATYVKTNTNNQQVTQEWGLFIYVQQFKEQVTGEADSAYQACRPYLNSIPLYFARRNRLQRSDQGLADVVSANITEHQGIDSARRNNRDYMGVFFTLTVVYDQQFEEI